MTHRDCRSIAQDLAQKLGKNQRFLALHHQAGHWRVLHQVGEGWDLSQGGPHLTLLKETHQNQRVTLVMETRNDPRFGTEVEFRSALCLPMLGLNGSFLGAVLLEDRERPRAFQFQDAETWQAGLEPLIQALEQIPVARSEPTFWNGRRLTVVGLVVATSAACGLFLVRPLPEKAKPAQSRLQTRQVASPETVAASFVGALSRRDDRAAFALTSEGQSGSINQFIAWADQWKGEQRQAWSLQFREVILEKEEENRCRVLLQATGPAQGMPALHLQLEKLEEGWRVKIR